MKYVGTRTDKYGKFSFEDAIFSPGYLPDGGLLIPEEVPQLSRSTLLEWSKLSYQQLCKEIFALFVGEDEVPRSDLNGIVDRAMSKLKLPEVLRVARLSNNLNILEMFHTRTLAFKDLSMSSTGQFMQYFLAKRSKRVILIVGTSGDTGASAIEAVRGLDGIDLVILLPRCSQIQQLSMMTAIDKNIHVISAPDMSSDDIDFIIKPVCTDAAFRDQHQIGTLNSINWGRVMGQIVNFFYGYFSMCPACDKEVEIVIPTGGGGNMAGGCIAKQMGLPIKMVLAVNSNDIVYRTIEQNDYSMKTCTPTLSTAMDIQLPYNLERAMYLFSKGDIDQVREVMAKFDKDGKSSLGVELWNKMRETISSYSVSDDTIKATMQRCWKENAYTLCPHTAVAVAYAYHRLANPDKNGPPFHLCFATASPAKFPEAVRAAGLQEVVSEETKQWLSLPTRFSVLHPDGSGERVLRERVEAITAARQAGLTGDLYESGKIPL